MKYRIPLCNLALVLASSLLLQACIPLVAAGVGTGVSATLDRRTYAEQIMDSEIEHKFNHSFPAGLESKTQVSATAFNRWILLTGQAIDATSRNEVEERARGIANVREVFNEITLGYPASFTTRSNDSLITSNVKTRLFDSPYVSGHHVKVVTESGVVYLMGEVTEGEAKAATETARMASGVRKVVSIFEIISEERARQLSPNQTKNSAADTQE